jgi:hypothetical protein
MHCLTKKRRSSRVVRLRCGSGGKHDMKNDRQAEYPVEWKTSEPFVVRCCGVSWCVRRVGGHSVHSLRKQHEGKAWKGIAEGYYLCPIQYNEEKHDSHNSPYTHSLKVDVNQHHPQPPTTKPAVNPLYSLGPN